MFLSQNEHIALDRVFRCDVSGPVTGSEQQRLTGSIIKTAAVNSEAVSNELKRVLSALRGGGTGDDAALKKNARQPLRYDSAANRALSRRPDLLLVVPDPKLADLPMGVFLCGSSGSDYPIRHFALAYFPSLQSVATMLASPQASCGGQVVSVDSTDGAPAGSDSGIALARPWARVTLAGTLPTAASARRAS